MVLILAITSLLVNAPPARSALGNQNLATAITPDLKNNKVNVDVILTPGKQGANTLHITVLKPNGKVFDVEDLTMSISNAKRDLGPIKIPLNKLSAGHYIAEGFNIPFAGKWKIVAKPLLTKFDVATLTDTIDVDPGTRERNVGYVRDFRGAFAQIG